MLSSFRTSRLIPTLMSLAFLYLVLAPVALYTCDITGDSEVSGIIEKVYNLVTSDSAGSVPVMNSETCTDRECCSDAASSGWEHIDCVDCMSVRPLDVDAPMLLGKLGSSKVVLVSALANLSDQQRQSPYHSGCVYTDAQNSLLPTRPKRVLLSSYLL